MLQNTSNVQVFFVGLHGSIPLALALLIAMVAGIMSALILGTARIGQRHRLVRRHR